MAKRKRLTPMELESGLAWALDVAVMNGWKPIRCQTVDAENKFCCPLGALFAVGLESDLAADAKVEELGDLVGLNGDEVDQLVAGFDDEDCRGSYVQVGANLAAIFVKDEDEDEW